MTAVGERAETASNPPAIAVEDVTKSYGHFTAVDGLSFAVERGSTVGLFGPNGAGKTTLLRMMAGLARPTRGTITVDGVELAPDDYATYRTIGVVTHETMLYDDLTARENLRFHADLHGVDDPADRCASVLDTVGLSRRGSDRPAAFSHGLRKRLSLARALLHDPEVLLLDEPYTGLDQHSAADLEAVLDGFDDRTVVLTTHDLERGVARCDRGLVVDRGRLEADLALGDAASFAEAYRRTIGVDSEREPRGDPAR
ncbi:ABC transporter ATP-binding protein [Halobellus limi]|uniref:ABC transporter ATP-binding protein n=1 Tax=Halobellus limi TaxID=699433 RepID=A0A1H5WFS9_9EURY|nr:ABC transporter ATP-binding protein [Halobellus limi]QCC46456.1 ABC transporter ATP-binding protein [Halobellus limi]SEF98305.1 heme exporter protein A [Halobellus limi]